MLLGCCVSFFFCYFLKCFFAFVFFYLFFSSFNAGNDSPCADSDSILSATLMETRNQEGLNYLVLVKEGNPGEEYINSAEIS